MHTNGKMMFKKYALPELRKGESVLEVGPARGNTIIKDAVVSCGCGYVYADVQNFDIGRACMIPMDGPYMIQRKDRTFDIVLSAQVLEHVADPFRWVKELARVAERAVILIAPFSYPVHGDADYWRVTSLGMRQLMNTAGLKVKLSVCESLDGNHTDAIGIGVKP